MSGWNSQIIRIDELTAAQQGLWRALQAQDRTLSSPYFTLDFAQHMSRVRSDTAVVVLSRNGTTRGFLPLHLPASGLARPLGGPMGDHHGLICDDVDIDLASLLPSPVSVFKFHGALASQSAFTSLVTGAREPSWVVDLSVGYTAYRAQIRKNHANQARSLASRERRLEALGERVRFRANDRRPDMLHRLIRMKREQYAATGANDVFRVDWSNRLLENLHAQTEGSLRGVLSTLEIDDKLVAAHFGIKSQTDLHYWFPVYNPEFSRYGPGLQLILRIAENAQALGIEAIHFGPGDFDYKRNLANDRFDVVRGQFARPSLVGAGVLGLQAADQLARSLPLGRLSDWPGKAWRRIDTWSALHAF
ncbi:GNAT family N-acetyltransferase [Maricaulis sp. CAU 1757]